MAQERELAAWQEFHAFCPVAPSNIENATVGSRQVLTLKVIEGKTPAQPRLVIKGFQGPDSRQGLVETARRVSLRSPHV